MPKKKNVLLTGLLSFLIFAVIFLFHYNAGVNFGIKGITPLLLLPAVAAFSMFASPGVAAVTGLLTGICMDGCDNGAICFNAVFLMLSAAMISALSSYLFNKNIRSSLVISVILCFLYFSLKWIIFYAVGDSFRERLAYLTGYALPTALITAVFVIPFYFIFKYFDRLKSK